MQFVRNSNTIRLAALSAFIAAGSFVSQAAFADHHEHTSGPFAGVKVNGGTVTHSKSGNNNILTLSDDFKVPDTPDPHWRVVDSMGNVYDLQKLAIKGDKINKSITIPAYVKDTAKVQIWCAFAETLLGEASFAKPQK
jgi:hypothetical protein